MSEEKKTVELKDEDLEKVNGGFGEDPAGIYDSLREGDRVRVREMHDGFNYVYYTGQVVGKHTEYLDPYGINQWYFITVKLDNSIGTRQYLAEAVEKE